MTPTFTLRDFNGTLVEDVSRRFVAQGSYIRRDSTAEVDGTAVFNFQDVEDFDFGRHLLECEVEIRDTIGRERPLKYKMGRWVMQPPDINLDSNELVSIACLDVVSLISTRLEAVFSVGPGTNVADAITSLLRRHGIVGLSGTVNEEGQPLEIPFELSTYGNWNITDPVTYLQIINQMLEASAYVGMYADRFGQLASYPWTELKRLSPAGTLITPSPTVPTLCPRRSGSVRRSRYRMSGWASPPRLTSPARARRRYPALCCQQAPGRPTASRRKAVAATLVCCSSKCPQ